MQYQPQLVVIESQIAKVQLVLDNPFFEQIPLQIGLSNLQVFTEIQNIRETESHS